MICPFSTFELKSAESVAMRPLTWAPTCTVTVAWSVPLAVTRPTIFCLRAGAVLYSNSGGAEASRQRRSANAPPATTSSTTTQTTSFLTRTSHRPAVIVAMTPKWSLGYVPWYG